MRYIVQQNQITFYDHSFQTLEEFFLYYKQSKSNQYKYLMDERIFIHEKVIKDKYTNIVNQPITLLLKEETIDWACNEKPCKVIYEDPFVLIVHKPSSMIIHSEKNDANCLNGMVAKYYQDHAIHTSIRPIHRLDEDTVGLVMYSKIPFFQPWFDDALSHKDITRIYEAITFGKAKPKHSKTIHASIGRDRHQSNRYRISKNGKPSTTHIQCLAVKNNYTLWECKLETGRTHQIRVHLSSIQYPIVNDMYYGRVSKDFKEMGLWAKKLIYKHPITLKTITVIDIPNKQYQYFD